MALETIIEQQDRPPEVLAQIDVLVDVLNRSDLDVTDRNSLVQSIQALRQESVGQAGRRLADRLGARTYHGLTPRAFFKHVYGLRSQLAHGHHPRPARDDVDITAVELERFVGDLLGIALIDDEFRDGLNPDSSERCGWPSR